MYHSLGIRINELSHFYQSKMALNKVSWVLNPGKVYVLLGSNGSGKTTLLNLLAGAIKPTSGNIEFIDLLTDKNIQISQKNIGYLTEFPYFYPFLSATEMIRLVGQLRELEKSFLENQIEKWLEILDLTEYRNQRMDTLSQGTKKRVAFINSVIHQPDIILLDEPTNGLDPQQIVLFRNVIRKISKDGAIILLSTHNMDVAEKTGDEVGIIYENALKYVGENTGDLETLYLNFGE